MKNLLNIASLIKNCSDSQIKKFQSKKFSVKEGSSNVYARSRSQIVPQFVDGPTAPDPLGLYGKNLDTVVVPGFNWEVTQFDVGSDPPNQCEDSFDSVLNFPGVDMLLWLYFLKLYREQGGVLTDTEKASKFGTNEIRLKSQPFSVWVNNYIMDSWYGDDYVHNVIIPYVNKLDDIAVANGRQPYFKIEDYINKLVPAQYWETSIRLRYRWPDTSYWDFMSVTGRLKTSINKMKTVEGIVDTIYQNTSVSDTNKVFQVSSNYNETIFNSDNVVYQLDQKDAISKDPDDSLFNDQIKPKYLDSISLNQSSALSFPKGLELSSDVDLDNIDAFDLILKFCIKDQLTNTNDPLPDLSINDNVINFINGKMPNVNWDSALLDNIKNGKIVFHYKPISFENNSPITDYFVPSSDTQGAIIQLFTGWFDIYYLSVDHAETSKFMTTINTNDFSDSNKQDNVTASNIVAEYFSALADGYTLGDLDEVSKRSEEEIFKFILATTLIGVNKNYLNFDQDTKWFPDESNDKLYKEVKITSSQDTSIGNFDSSGTDILQSHVWFTLSDALEKIDLNFLAPIIDVQTPIEGDNNQMSYYTNSNLLHLGPKSQILDHIPKDDDTLVNSEDFNCSTIKVIGTKQLHSIGGIVGRAVKDRFYPQDIGSYYMRIFESNNVLINTFINKGQLLTDYSKSPISIIPESFLDVDSQSSSSYSSNSKGNTDPFDHMATIMSNLLPAVLYDVKNSVNSFSKDADPNKPLEVLTSNIHKDVLSMYSSSTWDFNTVVIQSFLSKDTINQTSGYSSLFNNVTSALTDKFQGEIPYSQEDLSLYVDRLEKWVTSNVSQLFKLIKGLAVIQPAQYLSNFIKEFSNIINAKYGSDGAGVSNMINQLPSYFANWKSNLSQVSLWDDHDQFRLSDPGYSKLYDLIDSNFKTQLSTEIDNVQDLVHYILSTSANPSKHLNDDSGNVADDNSQIDPDQYTPLAERLQFFFGRYSSIFTDAVSVNTESVSKIWMDIVAVTFKLSAEIISIMVSTLAKMVVVALDNITKFTFNVVGRMKTLIGLGSGFIVHSNGDPVDAMDSDTYNHGVLFQLDNSLTKVKQNDWVQIFNTFASNPALSADNSAIVIYNRAKTIQIYIDRNEWRVYSSAFDATGSKYTLPMLSAGITDVAKPDKWKQFDLICQYSNTLTSEEKARLNSVANVNSELDNLPRTHGWIKWLSPIYYVQQAIKAMNKQTNSHADDLAKKVLAAGPVKYICDVLGVDSLTQVNKSLPNGSNGWTVEHHTIGWVPNFRLTPNAGLAGFVYEVTSIVIIGAILATIMTKGSFLGKLIGATSSGMSLFAQHEWYEHKQNEQDRDIISRFKKTYGSTLDPDNYGVKTDLSSVNDQFDGLHDKLDNLSNKMDSIEVDDSGIDS